MTLEECIRRIEEQMARFEALPDKAVHMNVLIDFNEQFYHNQNWPEKLHVHHIPCNSVGCIKGWVRVFLREQAITGEDEFEYLGLKEWQTETSMYMFLGRLTPHLTHKAEGLLRYVARLRELKALVPPT